MSAFLSDVLNAAVNTLVDNGKLPMTFSTCVPYTADPSLDVSFGYGAKQPFAGEAGLTPTKGYNTYSFAQGTPGVVWNANELRWTNSTGSEVTITHILLDPSAGMGAYIIATLDTPAVVANGATFTRFATAIQIKIV